MMDIQLGDELHFKNGEVSRVVDVGEMYEKRGFYLTFLTSVHCSLDTDNKSTFWCYDNEGKVVIQNPDLAGNDIVQVIHKGIDDFLHLYEGDVIITSNGSEAKIAENVVLIRKQTTVRLMDKININTETYKARRLEYITVNRDNLFIMSAKGPDTRIIKIIRGDRNEEKDV